MAIEFYDSLNVDSNDDSYFLGNVGIGTTSPGYKLQINDGNVAITGGTSSTLFMNINTNQLYGDVNGVVILKANDNLRLNTNGAERVRIINNGNVGIGTTSPSYKLDVNGDARFSSDVRFDESLLDVNGATGTSGQILSSEGAGGGVEWIDAPSGGSGTVTSIVAGTGLTGGTITTSGTIALDYAGNDNFITAGGTQLTSADNQDSLAIVDVSDLRTVKYIEKEDFLEDQVTSVITGEPSGSDSVINIVSLTQAEYDFGTPVATTLYIIT